MQSKNFMIWRLKKNSFALYKTRFLIKSIQTSQLFVCYTKISISHRTQNSISRVTHKILSHIYTKSAAAYMERMLPALFFWKNDIFLRRINSVLNLNNFVLNNNFTDTAALLSCISCVMEDTNKNNIAIAICFFSPAQCRVRMSYVYFSLRHTCSGFCHIANTHISAV